MNVEGEGSCQQERERERWLVEKTLAGSGFTAALVDVVLHQGDDLLELVVQLSATRSGVRLQRVHHLKKKKKKERKQQR